MCFPRWTSLAAAFLLGLALPFQALALTSLGEQQSGGLVSAPAKAAEPTGEQGEAGERPEPEAAAVSVPVSAEQVILDQAVLGDPLEPSSQALDQVVEDVMDDLVADHMSTYQRLKACYDYVTSNTSYGDHMAYMSTPIGGGTCWDVYQSYGEVEGFGAVALTAGKGMCNAYASAFILMARHMGLDARLVKGATLSGGGTYAYHEWAEISIDGTPYVFDPQLEQSLVRSGLPAYSVFCKPYAALGGRYRK